MRFVLTLAVIAVASANTAAQSRRALPPGNQITAQDGDTIVLEGDARVRIVRSRDAVVRVVFNATERWVILLADFVVNGKPDGGVDVSYHFGDVGGEWPMEARWQGRATLVEYSVAPQGRSSLAFTGPRGVIQFVSPMDRDEFRDPNAIAHLSYRSAGNRGADGVSFDEAEQRELAEIRGQDRGPVSMQLELVGPPGTADSGNIARSPDGAVRVGSGIRPPEKIVDVPPVTPAQAIQARVKGVVIVEITIGVDGTVTDARILRSIPLLDQAALDAVRQWRYAPTMLNGRTVPIVMTAAVTFP